MTYTYGCTHGYSESSGKDNTGGENFSKAIKYICLQMETRGDPLDVTYEHVTKRVAKVKTVFTGATTLRREWSNPNVTMIHVMHSFVENAVIFLIPAYYKFA